MSRLAAIVVAGVAVALGGCRDASRPVGPDSANLGSDGSPWPPGFRLTVVITSPADSAAFAAGTFIPFEGKALASDGGDLSDSLRWTLGDSLIGVGPRFWTILPVGTHVIIAQIAIPGGAPASDSVTLFVGPDSLDTAPMIVVLIRGGPPFRAGQEITFFGTAWDREDGDLSERLVWSIDDSVGGAGPRFAVTLPEGNYVITAQVADSHGALGSVTIPITVVSEEPNAPPAVGISSPVDGGVFAAGDSILFEGTASDAEDGDLSEQLIWAAGREIIGAGARFWKALPEGTHTVRAWVMDSAWQVGFAEVTVTVQRRYP